MAFVIPKSVINRASTIEYNMTSMASSIHPSPPAISDRRWAVESFAGMDRPSTSFAMGSLLMVAKGTLWRWKIRGLPGCFLFISENNSETTGLTSNFLNFDKMGRQIPDP